MPLSRNAAATVKISRLVLLSAMFKPKFVSVKRLEPGLKYDFCHGSRERSRRCLHVDVGKGAQKMLAERLPQDLSCTRYARA